MPPSPVPIELEPLARSIDPKRLSSTEFVHLVQTVHLLLRTGVVADLSSIGTGALVRLINRASDEQLAMVLCRPDLRTTVLAEILRRIPAHVHPARAAGVRAVLHVRLSDSPADERLQLVLADGTCAAGLVADRDATVTLTATAVDFLRLALSVTSAAVLLATRRVSLDGDLGPALRLLRCFDLPRG